MEKPVSLADEGQLVAQPPRRQLPPGVRGPRPRRADPNHRSVHLSQGPLCFHVSPPPRGGCFPAAAAPGTNGPPCDQLAKRRPSSPLLTPLLLPPWPITPGGFPRLCPTPPPGLALLQLFPRRSAPHPRHRRRGGPGSGRAGGDHPLGVSAARPGFPCPRPSPCPPRHAQSPAQLPLVSSGGAIIFPSLLPPAFFPLPKPSGEGSDAPQGALQPRCPPVPPRLRRQKQSPGPPRPCTDGTAKPTPAAFSTMKTPEGNLPPGLGSPKPGSPFIFRQGKEEFVTQVGPRTFDVM